MFDCNSNEASSDLPIIHHTNPFDQFPQLDDAHHHHHNLNNYSCLNFPSNLLDDDDLFLGTILPYQAHPPPPPPPPTTEETATDNKQRGKYTDEQKPVEKGKRKRGSTKLAKGGGIKRRTGKKDRHSKINTAHGPRDRRMRLSLQIARKFFDLQDMLGFDKASKTIEWLFNKSKLAIKDLAERSCTTMALPSSPSEDISNKFDKSINDEKLLPQGRMNKMEMTQKENREKARARARERTKEKQMILQKEGKGNLHEATYSNLEQNSRNPSTSRCNLRGDHLPLEDQMASVGIIEKFLGNPSSRYSSSSIFNLDHEEDDDDHGDQVLRAAGRLVSCDLMMRSNEIEAVDFPGNWVTQNPRVSGGYGAVTNKDDTFLSGNEIIQVQCPNSGSSFMGRSYNLQGH